MPVPESQKKKAATAAANAAAAAKAKAEGRAARRASRSTAFHNAAKYAAEYKNARSRTTSTRSRTSKTCRSESLGKVTGNQRAVSDDASCGTLYAGCGAGQALQVAAAEVGTVRSTSATQPWMSRSWSAQTPRQPAEPGPPRVPSAHTAPEAPFIKKPPFSSRFLPTSYRR